MGSWRARGLQLSDCSSEIRWPQRTFDVEGRISLKGETKLDQLGVWK
jgi:hypothetical protein